MAVDMFMKIDKLGGESKDEKHKDTIDVLAWSWGMSQSGTTHMGGGAGAGKANFQDLSFTKWIDKTSTNLMLACAKGTHFDEAKLTVRKAGDTPLEYLIITMKDLIVTSVSTGGSGGEDRLTENVTLNFSFVSVTYHEQDDKGASKGEADMHFKIAENVGDATKG